MSRRKITRPRQAASKSSLNRFQRTIRACLRRLRPPLVNRTEIAYVRRKLVALDAAIGRAERRG